MGSIILKSAAQKLAEPRAKAVFLASLGDYLANVYGELTGIDDAVNEATKLLTSDDRIGLTQDEGEAMAELFKDVFLAYDKKFRAPHRTYRFAIDSESDDFLSQHLLSELPSPSPE